MHFIGIFSNNLEYEIIKQNINKLLKKKDLNLIHITSKNIENLKNIVFETIVLCNKENMKNKEKIILNKMCNNCEFIIINSDIFCNTKIMSNKKINCISYGLNQKSTITTSSIQEDKIIIYLQRNLINLKQNRIEMGEMELNLKEYKVDNIENILAIFAIYLIYTDKSTEK